jgi:tryptophan-rich sensory protein
MIDTTIAFQWFAALAFFLIPVAGPYTMPTFYEDELRKQNRSKNDKTEEGEEEKPQTFRQIVSSPAAWIFTPIWWVVNVCFAAVAVLYWQGPSLTHPDRADTVFALMIAIPFLELLWSYLFFRPYSFVGAAVVAWVLLIDIALQWAFIVWSGNTETAIMILLVPPSIWLLIAAPLSTIAAVRVDIHELVELVEKKRVALNQLLAMQMKGKISTLASQIPQVNSARLRTVPSHTYVHHEQ